MPPGVGIDHLDAVARGVGDEHKPAFGIERGMIEFTAASPRDGDNSGRFQRHDGLTRLRWPSNGPIAT
jgi:hypothetical protein